MLPIRFDPMRELSTLQREMDELFKRVFGTTRDSGDLGVLAGTPVVNSYIKNGIFHLEAELPGIDTDKLDVRMDANDLVIRAERCSTHKEKDVDYLLQESRLSTFERRLNLPAGADIDKAHASYENGILEVTIPVTTTEPSGRKIPIEGVKTGKKSKEIH